MINLTTNSKQIKIAGPTNESYNFSISEELIPETSYLKMDSDDIRRLPFSDNIIMSLEKYFIDQYKLIDCISYNPVEIFKSDLDAIHYCNSCLEIINLKMINKNYFSENFHQALKEKNNLLMVPKINGKLYLTITFFNHILNYLGLCNTEFIPISLKLSFSFGADFKFIKDTVKKINFENKLKKMKLTRKDYEQKIILNKEISVQKNTDKIIRLQYNIRDRIKYLTYINFDTHIPLPILIIIVSPLISDLYEYFELVYLLGKKKTNIDIIPGILETWDSKFVCLIESIYLRILSRSKNKNRIGFVHFYKYFMDKKCDCSTIHNLKSNELIDEIKFIATLNYHGCSPTCSNFYENKWDCSEFESVDPVVDEPIDDDFVIWNESSSEEDADIYF